MEGKFSEKSDIFSFGVLILEIVSGRRNSSFVDEEWSMNLLGYVRWYYLLPLVIFQLNGKLYGNQYTFYDWHLLIHCTHFRRGHCGRKAVSRSWSIHSWAPYALTMKYADASRLVFCACRNYQVIGQACPWCSGCSVGMLHFLLRSKLHFSSEGFLWMITILDRGISWRILNCKADSSLSVPLNLLFNLPTWITEVGVSHFPCLFVVNLVINLLLFLYIGLLVICGTVSVFGNWNAVCLYIWVSGYATPGNLSSCCGPVWLMPWAPCFWEVLECYLARRPELLLVWFAAAAWEGKKWFGSDNSLVSQVLNEKTQISARLLDSSNWNRSFPIAINHIHKKRETKGVQGLKISPNPSSSRQASIGNNDRSEKNHSIGWSFAPRCCNNDGIRRIDSRRERRRDKSGVARRRRQQGLSRRRRRRWHGLHSAAIATAAEAARQGLHEVAASELHGRAASFCWLPKQIMMVIFRPRCAWGSGHRFDSG